ncbi:hypothetical protein SAMN04515617_1374 [Collimonas sp. OK242]|jgi:hypothetical protein|uniref:hypothetical protein n=1 Tax=Collimonas sp. OK242 TaxID=1798195 RepID=UPI00089AEED2|nr:hypothetical protein [Collimonas sp. OK242]SDY96461.1 hypothetical protein SAMN04515617_1374 [Collimonas sp. OK242]
MQKNVIISAALLCVAMSTAIAQENSVSGSLDSPKSNVSAECKRLQARIEELNRMDDERIARAKLPDGGAQQSPVQTREWIAQERKDAKTKMFFAKC